ncbi:acyl-CoA thioester hydrolase [Methylomarinovum tepidoasis]|uniref:Acyl-CoA thioester hydrolase n=1 Tax=Methylomarinovum tepidoasis TaxID=2840183 RepID=A0AAU9D0F1_9GAMM|nr:tol-pal system-associated acyl-CoA thioesterase [Methylomarinovum sp. IN45]BCX88449.1 acyl-CoA thioester hydrolase [Methylomarinovum sp. IN45]
MAEFTWPVRVYYEDTDAGGVVYYANYLRFFERTRTEFLRALGFEQDELSAREGILFVVRSVQADYRRPARFNDLLTVSCEVAEVKRASLVFFQQVRRGDAVLCEAAVRIACLDARSFRPRPIPPALIQRIKDY